jgi:hypothetical protein
MNSIEKLNLIIVINVMTPIDHVDAYKGELKTEAEEKVEFDGTLHYEAKISCATI